MNIEYIIQIHSWWHCGSGLAAGGDADMLVAKDKDGLPYIPGKTMKGLVREAAEELLYNRGYNEDLMKSIFGIEESTGTVSYFSDALLTENREEIISKELTKYLFSSLSRTMIDKNGVAVDSSLRKIEVTVPCRLTGHILFVPEDGVKLIEESLAFIKRLGTNRNRGLGRCTITIKK